VHTIGSTKADSAFRYRRSFKEVTATKHDNAIGISEPTAMTGMPKNNRNTRERGIANNATKSRNSPVAKNVGHIKKSRPNRERPDPAEDVDIDFHICLIEIVACCGWWPTTSPAKVAALWQRRAQLWAKVTERLECQETGDDFNPLKDRSWPENRRLRAISGVDPNRQFINDSWGKAHP
jgi:hypothetical protein